jgi:hypothetical protein
MSARTRTVRGGRDGDAVGAVAVAALRGEDRDALLALVDLAAEGLPGFVAGDGGGVGALGEDQQGVAEGVGVEARGSA